MPNGERISDERSREWEQALNPYGNDVEEFAREKGLEVDKWYHDLPIWHIGKPQRPSDLNKIWWHIQLGYNANKQELLLTAIAWMDTEYDVSDGRVRERRVSDSPERHLVAWWKKKDQIRIEELLQIAYNRAISYTLQDLTNVSAVITGEDRVPKPYNLH